MDCKMLWLLIPYISNHFGMISESSHVKVPLLTKIKTRGDDDDDLGQHRVYTYVWLICIKKVYSFQ